MDLSPLNRYAMLQTTKNMADKNSQNLGISHCGSKVKGNPRIPATVAPRLLPIANRGMETG